MTSPYSIDQKISQNKRQKTYNRRDSQMVTHSSTSRPVQCLCMAERTGCPVLTDLWSYVPITRLFGLAYADTTLKRPSSILGALTATDGLRLTSVLPLLSPSAVQEHEPIVQCIRGSTDRVSSAVATRLLSPQDTFCRTVHHRSWEMLFEASEVCVTLKSRPVSHLQKTRFPKAIGFSVSPTRGRCRLCHLGLYRSSAGSIRARKSWSMIRGTTWTT
jgi:hypothetical protein